MANLRTQSAVLIVDVLVTRGSSAAGLLSVPDDPDQVPRSDSDRHVSTTLPDGLQAHQQDLPAPTGLSVLSLTLVRERDWSELACKKDRC